MSKLLILAVLLLIVWVVLKVVLHMVGFFLHLFWIAAIIIFIFWVINKLRGAK